MVLDMVIVGICWYVSQNQTDINNVSLIIYYITAFIIYSVSNIRMDCLISVQYIIAFDNDNTHLLGNRLIFWYNIHVTF